jgi:pimeloyl-ACP methyl ester carboxylesterase
MKDEDLFSHDGPPPTASDHERGGDGDRSALSSTHTMPQEAPASAHPLKSERRLTARHPLRLLLVAMMVVVVLVVLAGGYSVFRDLFPTSRQAPSAFQVSHCPFALDATLVEGKNVTCGFLVVPEDRSSPKGPTIRLAVAIFKTRSSKPDPDPVLFLSGGPGVALLETMGPRYNAGNIPSNRDLILLDQRGVGYSQPSLRCLDNETLQACHTRLVKSGINLNAFTTLENADDVHDLIRALGYQQVNLEGVSYGTRLALTVMRLFPADLRSAVLNSVYPQQVNLFTSIPQATIRAFDVLFQGCAADRYCNATYPHLQAVFYQLVADLNSTPITFQATPPLRGVPVTVHFTGNDLVLWLRQSLYSTYLIPQLPTVIFHMRQHDYTQFASIYGNLIDTTSSDGLFYSIECGEDMAFTAQHDLETSVQGLLPQIQPALLDFGLYRFSICQFWGMKPVPAVQKEPVRSTIPTLILQSEYDPVTPPANGMLAAQTLSKSYFFLFPGVGHGVGSPNSCPNDITKAFWENPTEKPDASCISSMPEPFFT